MRRPPTTTPKRERSGHAPHRKVGDMWPVAVDVEEVNRGRAATFAARHGGAVLARRGRAGPSLARVRRSTTEECQAA
jgi:ribosomal protein L19